MPERNVIERLDEVVETILAGRAPAVVDPEVAMLAAVAADLRDLPDPAFKSSLRKRLVPEKEERMPTAALPKLKPGFHSLTPYFVVKGAPRLIEFMQQAFGAELVARFDSPDGSRIMHSEIRIGDSMIELGEPEGDIKSHRIAMHLYVGNAGEVYDRALAAGAESLLPLTDQWYGDREGSVRDPLGNHWYIATHLATGSKPSPDFGTVTPFIHVRGTDRLIDYMKRAFGAEELDRSAAPDGLIMHAVLRVGDSVVEMGEAHGDWEPMPMHIHLYVPDADAVYQQAIDAGGTVSYPINDAPYGERIGGVTDPFGNVWYIATPL